MTITYHSQNRKELVKALSEIIGIQIGRAHV